MGDGADAARETEEMASFSLDLAGLAPSPFYDPSENTQLQKGVIRHAALEPVDPHDLTKGFQLVDDKPGPKLFEKITAADNHEEIYSQLDRAISMVESENPVMREEGLHTLYELRDAVYRGLR